MKIDIIFAEFGVVNVDVDHFRSYFPDARFILVTDAHSRIEKGKFDQKYTVNGPFGRQFRYGNRMNDLWQIEAMFRSDADVCLAFDSDVRIVSDDIKTIIPLVKKFGLCLPANPRMLVRHDATIGMDGGSVDDPSTGTGFALNCAITALDMHDGQARYCAWTFCQEMRLRPVRGPLAWWRAIWATGFNPYLLPFQWCVCSDHVGIGNEIMLHVGHKQVFDYYNETKLI
jgi:hypothetical protein